MFIVMSLKIITAPAEPNVADAYTHRVRWSANPVDGWFYKHLAVPRPTTS